MFERGKQEPTIVDNELSSRPWKLSEYQYWIGLSVEELEHAHEAAVASGHVLDAQAALEELEQYREKLVFARSVEKSSGS